MKWHHYAMLAVILFLGYWLGERYGGKLKSLPLVGAYT